MFGDGAASLVTASTLPTNFKAAVSVENFSSSPLVVGGIGLTAVGITGIVSTITHFLPQEFYFIEPGDREYVCSEAGAFFVYFLSALQCKKLNPPSSKSLCGPGMHRLEWMKTAHALGIPVWRGHIRNGVPVTEESPAGLQAFRSTIVGGATVEDRLPSRVREYAAGLSRALRMPYLGLGFVSSGEDDYVRSDLTFVPDLAVTANRAAIVAYMKESQP